MKKKICIVILIICLLSLCSCSQNEYLSDAPVQNISPSSIDFFDRNFSYFSLIIIYYYIVSCRLKKKISTKTYHVSLRRLLDFLALACYY